MGEYSEEAMGAVVVVVLASIAKKFGSLWWQREANWLVLKR